MPWGGGYGNLGMMFVFGLGFVVFVVVLIVLGFFLVRALSGSGSGRSGTAASATESAGRALVILQERYARGEITKEQYDQMRADLNA
jgi:putative membrane protein